MNLRCTTTATALLAAALASVAAPGWSDTLRLEGYYDYVDLSLSLQLPNTLTPGAASVVAAVAANAGPGTADYPVLLLSTDAALQAEGVSGCVSPAVPQRTCALQAIAADTSQTASLLLHVDPFARGTVVLGAAVSSEAIETRPGDEISVVALPLVAEAETRVAFVDTKPEVMPDGRLLWQVNVDNDGPSAAIAPAVVNASVSFGGPVLTECRTDASSSCPETLNYLSPGSGWTMLFIAQPLSRDNPEIQVGFHVQPREIGNDPGNDGVFLVYRDVLLIDNFE